MKIFLAAENTYKVSKYLSEQYIKKLNVLESYFYLTMKQKQNMEKELSKFNSFFLDSGAFSAWTQNATINIDEYTNFCIINNIKHYAVLDKIGDAEGTLKNQKYMENKGAKPIPCFHYGEDWKYLDEYCEKYDYVALGGMVPITTKKLERWLDVVFTKYPNQKFHGFGLTVLRLMQKYPWYSVDSTSWKVGGMTGSIYNPHGCFCISSNYRDKHGYDKPNHFNKQNEIIKKDVKKYIEDKGYKWNELIASDGALKRVLLNSEYFIDLQEEIKHDTFKPIQNQLETFFKGESEKKEDEVMPGMKIIDVRIGAIKEEFPDIGESGLKVIFKQRYGDDLNI